MRHTRLPYRRELTFEVAEVRKQLVIWQLCAQGRVKRPFRAPCRQVELGYGVKLMHHQPLRATAFAKLAAAVLEDRWRLDAGDSG